MSYGLNVEMHKQVSPLFWLLVIYIFFEEKGGGDTKRVVLRNRFRAALPNFPLQGLFSFALRMVKKGITFPRRVSNNSIIRVYTRLAFFIALVL
jgi:hypothetical protein